MKFSSNDISLLRTRVGELISDKRYQHTLGVERMAKMLGEVLMPDRVDELAVAALLHDVAKEISYEDQAALLRASDDSYDAEELKLKPALHSIAAIPLIKSDFSDFATDDVLSAVANHTLGNDGMSVFDEIIFISDYAEEGRTYPTCVAARAFLAENVKSANSYEDNVIYLHKASLLSIDSTIESLVNRKEAIGERTFRTKKYLEDLISK